MQSVKHKAEDYFPYFRDRILLIVLNIQPLANSVTLEYGERTRRVSSRALFRNEPVALVHLPLYLDLK